LLARRRKGATMNSPPDPQRRSPVLTVLIPCFNEAGILRETASQLTAYLDAGQWRQGREGEWEILFVDDGSTDDSRSVLADLAARDPRVRFVSYRINAGQGQALQKGFAAARGDWIFSVDADLDYGPEHIGQFLALAHETGAEMVVGSPYMRGGSTSGVPAARLWMSRLMNWYFGRVLKLGLSTYTSILRLYRRETLTDLLLTSRDKDVLPEILIKAALLGVPIVEAPAQLRWKSRIAAQGRGGGGTLTTLRKAVRHLLWGVIENPLLFFLAPAVVAGAGTLWFAVAIAILFRRAYAATTTHGLEAVTSAASHVMQSNPQTVVIFAVLLHAALMLFCIGMVVFQNKVKKEQDFVYFSRLLARREKPEGGESDGDSPICGSKKLGQSPLRDPEES